MRSIRSWRRAAQESLPLMVGRLHSLNAGETSLEWGIWTKNISLIWGIDSKGKNIEMNTTKNSSFITGFILSQIQLKLTNGSSS